MRPAVPTSGAFSSFDAPSSALPGTGFDNRDDDAVGSVVPRLLQRRGTDGVVIPPTTLELKRQYAFRQTVLPSCLVLSGSAQVLAAAWFALDPTSVLRANPLGMALPIGLLVAAVVFGVLAVTFARQSAAMARTLGTDAV